MIGDYELEGLAVTGGQLRPQNDMGGGVAGRQRQGDSRGHTVTGGTDRRTAEGRG